MALWILLFNSFEFLYWFIICLLGSRRLERPRWCQGICLYRKPAHQHQVPPITYSAARTWKTRHLVIWDEIFHGPISSGHSNLSLKIIENLTVHKRLSPLTWSSFSCSLAIPKHMWKVQLYLCVSARLSKSLLQTPPVTSAFLELPHHLTLTPLAVCLADTRMLRSNTLPQHLNERWQADDWTGGQRGRRWVVCELQVPQAQGWQHVWIRVHFQGRERH